MESVLNLNLEMKVAQASQMRCVLGKLIQVILDWNPVLEIIVPIPESLEITKVFLLTYKDKNSFLKVREPCRNQIRKVLC